MKSKKKLLLLGVGAMGALAMGVGATSTFAWYTATTAVKLQNVSDVGYSINTAQSTAEAENVEITFTIAAKEGAPTVELSYVDGSTVKHGVMKNGLDLETTAWDGDNTDHVIISEYDVTAVLGTASAGQKAYLEGKSYTFALASQGNVQILDFDDDVNTATKDDFSNGDAKDAASSPTVTITFGSNGTISNYSISNPYYVVRTNNPTALEYVKTSGVHSEHGQVIGVASGNAADNTKGYDSTTYQVKNCTSNTWTALSPAVYLHEADKIIVTASQTVEHD